MKHPTISAVIPVYNGAQYLAGAIESVLRQTYASLDVIVIDDGSTDGTAQVAQQFKSSIRYFSQPHAGVAAALNLGIGSAHGEFLAFLAADDLWLKNKTEVQLAAFESDPSLDIVYGHIQQFISPELDAATKNKLHCPPDPAPGYLLQAMLATRHAMRRVGSFETQWQLGEALDWYARAKYLGLKMAMLPQLVALRRVHTTNLSIRRRDSQADLVRILKASLDRRRHGMPAKNDEARMKRREMRAEK